MNEGQTILVLHGGPGIGHQYLRPELDVAFEGLARLLYYDHRGGTFDRCVEDVEVERQSHGLKHPVVLGHSFGGMVAMQYAIRYPGCAAGLVLVDPDPASRALWARYTEVVSTRPQSADLGQHFASGVAPAGFGSRFPSTWGNAAKVRESMGDWDIHSRLPSITCPTLIVTGDQSIFPAEAMELLRDGIPDSSLVVLPNASHFPHMEAPDEFRRVVSEFLNSRAPRGRAS